MVKISLLFEVTMIKILTFFLALVLLSYYLTNAVLFVPLDALKSLESVFSYVVLALGIAIVVWLMGD